MSSIIIYIFCLIIAIIVATVGMAEVLAKGHSKKCLRMKTGHAHTRDA